MKAGQLARILQSVEPDTEISFSVGFCNEYRKALVKSVGKNPDILTELKADCVDISDMSTRLMVEVILVVKN